jgi:uncharacterized membrane protein
MILGKSYGKVKALLLFSTVLLQVLAVMPFDAGGGPTRGPGTDIEVSGIASHEDGEIIGFVSQIFSADLVNTGSVPYVGNVSATLTILYPGNETENMTEVHTETIDLGTTLEEVGNQTRVEFTPWLPMAEGFYRVRIVQNAFDDNPENDTAQIMIRVLSSHVEGVKVRMASGSPNNQKIKRGDNTQMFGYEPYVFVVENTGIYNDTYNITIDSEWVMGNWINQTTRTLEPGEVDLIAVNVEVPFGISTLSFDVLVFTVTSQRNETISASISVNTSIPLKPDVDVMVVSNDPLVGYPGGPYVEFAFRIENTGDWTNNYSLKLTANPSHWRVEFRSTRTTMETGNINVDDYRIVYARIWVPVLDLDTMEKDRTEEGQIGTLILTARDPSGVSDSAGATVDVGLVHTVEMEIEPQKSSINFTEVSKTSPQFLNISVRVRSINNNKADPGARMDVNLSTPDGPNGVQFKPVWQNGFEENISRSWIATPPVGMIKLKSGEWSTGQHVRVIVPPFPFQGTALIKIVATPLLIEGRYGLTISASEEAEIHVGGYLNFSVVPPRTEFFENLTEDVDENGNGIEDWREGSPGDVLRLPFNITNFGNGWDRYLLTGSSIPIQPSVLLPDDWELTFPTSTYTLTPYNFDPNSGGHSILAWVTVTVPDGAPIGESATVKIGAASFIETDLRGGDPRYQWAEIDVFVIQGFAVDLEPEENRKSAEPGETVLYRLNTTNTGNGADIIRFRIETDDLLGWNISFDVDQYNLTPNERRPVVVRVTPSMDAVRDQELSLKVRAQSQRSETAFDEVWLNTTVNYRGGVELQLLETPSLQWKYPGEVAVYVLDVYNRGNGNDTIDVTIDTGNSAWFAEISSGDTAGRVLSIDLERGQAARITVNISLPSMEDVTSESELYEQGIQAANKVSSILTAYPKGYASINSIINLTVGVLTEYGASLSLAPGDVINKEVLVGEKVSYQFRLENKGNGPDRIMALPDSPTNSLKHLSWTQIDEGPFDLRPFETRLVNLTVSPSMLDRPLYHEEIAIEVQALAGDNLTYMRIQTSTKVMMSRILTETLDIDLGTTGTVVLRLCNMPDPGVTPVLELPLQRTYLINTTLESGTFSRGWSIPDGDTEVTLTSAYQLQDVEVQISAPPDFITGSESAFINIDVLGGPDKRESLDAFVRGVYFDIAIDLDATKFRNLYEGAKGEATITLSATGNRGQDSIPLLIRMDDEVLGRFDAGPAQPQDFNTGLAAGGGNQQILYEFRFDLPTLKWYEKGKEMKLEVVLDPDDEIVENTPQGNSLSEANNVMVTDFTIKNYVPPIGVWVLALLLLLFMMIGGFIGYFFLNKKESWFLIPLSIGAAGGFGMMFFVPLEDAMDIGMANGIGLAIILIDLLFIMPVMIYFFTRSGDAHILHQINENRGDEPIVGMETTRSVWKPLIISLAGGLLMVAVPMLFWVVPSEMGEGVSAIVEALTSLDSGIPVIILILLIPMVSLGLQVGLITMKKRSLKKIRRSWDTLSRLRSEIEEGFQ